MKKVLIHEGDEGVDVWDVSTVDLEFKAYRSLFELFDKKVYSYLTADQMYEQHRQWYDEAKAGNTQSLENFLRARRTYKYEEWYITNVLP